jgi:hypothetical protein
MAAGDKLHAVTTAVSPSLQVLSWAPSTKAWSHHGARPWNGPGTGTAIARQCCCHSMESRSSPTQCTRTDTPSSCPRRWETQCFESSTPATACGGYPPSPDVVFPGAAAAVFDSLHRVDRWRRPADSSVRELRACGTSRAAAPTHK